MKNNANKDLELRLTQFRQMAADTTDPMAERLVRDIVTDLEDELSRNRRAHAHLRPVPPMSRLSRTR